MVQDPCKGRSGAGAVPQAPTWAVFAWLRVMAISLPAFPSYASKRLLLGKSLVQQPTLGAQQMVKPFWFFPAFSPA